MHVRVGWAVVVGTFAVVGLWWAEARYSLHGEPPAGWSSRAHLEQTLVAIARLSWRVFECCPAVPLVAIEVLTLERMGIVDVATSRCEKSRNSNLVHCEADKKLGHTHVAEGSPARDTSPLL